MVTQMNYIIKNSTMNKKDIASNLNFCFNDFE